MTAIDLSSPEAVAVQADAADLDVTLHLCACPEPAVVDRVCATCGRANLAALLAWRATWCACPEPDNDVHGLTVRTCRRCGGPVREALLAPPA